MLNPIIADRAQSPEINSGFTAVDVRGESLIMNHAVFHNPALTVSQPDPVLCCFSSVILQSQSLPLTLLHDGIASPERYPHKSGLLKKFTRQDENRCGTDRLLKTLTKYSHSYEKVTVVHLHATVIDLTMTNYQSSTNA